MQRFGHRIRPGTAAFCVLALLLEGLGQRVLPQEGAPLVSDIWVEVERIDLSFFPTARLWISVLGPLDTTVSGLALKDIEVRLDGQIVREIVLDSRYRDGARLHILVAIDVSGSMAAKRDAVSAAYQDLVSRLGIDDRLDVMVFSDRQQVMSTNSRGGEAVLLALQNLDSTGNTAIFDALLKGLSRFELSVGKEKAAILLSDGWDTSSEAELEDVVRAYSASDVPIFPVLLGEESDSATLKALAAGSGGKLAPLDAIAGLGPLYDRIAHRLRSQYLLSFLIPEEYHGRPVDLDVRVVRPGVEPDPGQDQVRHTFLADSRGPGGADSGRGSSLSSGDRRSVWVLMFGLFLTLGSLVLMRTHQSNPLERPMAAILSVVVLSGLLAFLGLALSWKLWPT